MLEVLVILTSLLTIVSIIMSLIALFCKEYKAFKPLLCSFFSLVILTVITINYLKSFSFNIISSPFISENLNNFLVPFPLILSFFSFSLLKKIAANS